MKITLTNDEAVELIRNTYFAKLGIKPIIEIADGFNSIVIRIANVVERFSVNEKISRIRALREIVSQIPELQHPELMGLADAKYAVENWDKFIQFLRDNGRMPQRNSYYYNDGLL